MSLGSFSVWTTAGAIVLLSPLGLRAQRLGEAPLPDGTSAAHAHPQRSGQSLAVDTQDRAAVVQFYQTVYKASQSIDIGWTGDVGNCVAGATSLDFHGTELT